MEWQRPVPLVGDISSGSQVRKVDVSAGGDPDVAAELLRRAGVATVVIDRETGRSGWDWLVSSPPAWAASACG